MSLDIEKLTVELGGREILHGVDLKINDGELFSLLGPSGCGKTTLLKTVAGLIVQEGGSVMLNGKCIDGLPPEKRDIAVVFQELRLFPNMNIAENVAFPLKMRGVKRKERLARAHELLEQVQLKDFDKRRITQLSGGQQQRVALARGIAANPKLLLLDEPFSALDENLRDDMRDLLTMLHGQLDTTMVLVTHDQNEALKLSDRIAIMDEGHVMQFGTPQDIYSNPANLTIARYFSNYNMVDGTCANGTFECPLLSKPCTSFEGKATCMVREPAIAFVEGEGGIEFKLTRLDYLGDKQRLVVNRHGIELEFEIDFHESLQVGDAVRLEIDPEKVMVFPAEN